jgi:Zn-dependent oligopeptidase
MESLIFQPSQPPHRILNLSYPRVGTLFHEFGHALDNLFSNITYGMTYRTSDFSELPSQIMEHWAMEPEVIKHYAKHYQTGETIPDNLIAKIENSGRTWISINSIWICSTRSV